ncbi:hypothetical protein [Christiangramia echinicola]|uniref:Secreted protein n=1 Tax=Christiangramia echinicola TaxID=279359 RepID=A0A1H1Q7W9_9FLAO|nr:hypothetical protein [Christiangramia echinicola]SDS19490.1 hypothetical protein SAMN04488552_2410 [Christiangramia echinicola]
MTSILKKYTYLLFLLLLPACYAQQSTMQQKDSLKFSNKIVPDTIWREAYVALSHYPELKDTPIEFRFKKNIKKSFMQAQPKVGGLFKNRKNRSYLIFINEKFTIEDEVFDITSVPSEVLIGWIGHELGHIMDYRDRSAVNLIWFGVKYVTSKNYIREAERAADTYAVNHGLGENIIATKNFIINHSKLSDSYKSRIEDLYLSPEEIMVLINESFEETFDD